MNILIQAHILLTVALTLLGMANTANVSPAFKLQAETAAHTAIDFATKVISEQAVTANSPANPSTSVVAGSVAQIPVQLSHMDTPQIKIYQLVLTDDTHGILISNVEHPNLTFIQPDFVKENTGETCDQMRGCSDYSKNNPYKTSITFDEGSVMTNGDFKYILTLSDSLLSLSGLKEGQNSDGQPFALFKASVNGLLSKEELQTELNSYTNIRFNN